jgi:hypothetical protein
MQSARTIPHYGQVPVLGTLGPVALGLLATALPVFLHVTNHMAAIISCVLLALVIANYATRTVPVVLIVAYLFQNFFVALVSPHLETLDELNSIRAYNFLLTAVTWLLLAASYWISNRNFDHGMRLLIGVSTGALVLIGFYFCGGLLADPVSAVIYLRNIATPFLLLQIFALAAYRERIELMGPLKLITAMALLYGYVELFHQEALHRLVNGDTYITLSIRQSYEAGAWVEEMRETGRVIRSYLDTMVIDFLNTPFLADWGFKLNRLVGPNFHSISFAYCVAGLAVILTGTRRWWFALLALPLLLAIGSKGALLLLVLSSVLLLAVSYLPALRRLWIVVGILVCYAAIGIWIGINADDYHVIGFLGGLRGFISNPLGHGLGVGGNLSLNMAAQIDWSRSQGLGHTDVAVESAVGVLLYQVGMGGILLLGVLAWVGKKLWRLYLVSLDPVFAVAAIAMLIMLVNGIFQEEALFSPLALGLLAALSGFLLGSVYRERSAIEGERKLNPRVAHAGRQHALQVVD